MEKIGTLNESNNAFLEYLMTNYTRETFAKKQNENTFGDWKIYCNNVNMQESI